MATDASRFLGVVFFFCSVSLNSDIKIGSSSSVSYQIFSKPTAVCVLQFPGDDMASASASRTGVALPFEKSQLTLKGEWHCVECLLVI